MDEWSTDYYVAVWFVCYQCLVDLLGESNAVLHILFE
ncbi:Uncharacterised protein [Segatella copri]|nr:Uncharacterised protein [Segatella copri]